MRIRALRWSLCIKAAEAEALMEEKGVLWSDRRDLDGLLALLGLKRLPEIRGIPCFLTRGRGYTLNTNGTPITPGIARLLTRKGTKMVALAGEARRFKKDWKENHRGYFR